MDAQLTELALQHSSKTLRIMQLSNAKRHIIVLRLLLEFVFRLKWRSFCNKAFFCFYFKW